MKMSYLLFIYLSSLSL